MTLNNTIISYQHLTLNTHEKIKLHEKSELEQKKKKKQYAVDCKILISLTMQNTHFKPNKPSEQA